MVASRKKRSHIWAMPADEFRQIIDGAASLSDAARKLDLRPIGGNHKTIKARCIVDGIDIAPLLLAGRRVGSASSTKIQAKPLRDVLVQESNYSHGDLKKRLIITGTLMNRCTLCGLGPHWNGRSLGLHLDHVNGISNDNRLENLRLLCPNCHSQTPTYTGRNNSYVKSVIEAQRCIAGCGTRVSSIGNRCKRCARLASPKFRIEWPEPSILLSEVMASSYLAVARRLGVSDNAVRKHCNRYSGLATPLFGLV